MNREVSKQEENLLRILSPISKTSNVINRITKNKKYYTVRELFEKIDVSINNIPSEIEEKLDTVVSQICRAGSRFSSNCICVELYEDGEEVANWAIEHGALFCVTHKQYERVPCLVVDNPIEVFSKLCKVYRQSSQAEVTAVIGSIGKTTTKRMIHSVYKTEIETFCDPENENQLDCVGYIAQHIPPKTKAIIQEISEDTPGYMNWISNIMMPGLIVVTQIDKSHIEQFGDESGIIDEILSVQNHAKDDARYIINIDDINIRQLFAGKEKITVSLENEEADYVARDIKLTPNGLEFIVINAQKGISEKVQLNRIFAEHNIYSALQAFAAGVELGISLNNIVKGLLDYRTAGKRQNIFCVKNNVTVYADCYNAVGKSIESAIDGLMSIPNGENGKRIAVIGDVEEAGNISDEIHNNIVSYADNSGVDILFCYGDKIKKAAEGYLKKSNPKSDIFISTDKHYLADCIRSQIAPNDLILFKASRKSSLEDIIKILWPKEYNKEIFKYSAPIIKWRLQTLLY